jgi:hypothetical protein
MAPDRLPARGAATAVVLRSDARVVLQARLHKQATARADLQVAHDEIYDLQEPISVQVTDTMSAHAGCLVHMLF